MNFRFNPPKIRYLKIMGGVALFLLIVNCERNEVQIQHTETMSQQEAINMFFNTYENNEDNFRDEAVDRLLAMNDSTGIIFDLARKYGEPQWNIGKTTTKKSATYLVTPVCVPGKDSVSATFVFLEQDSSLYLKIFEASNPDTLISDLPLVYQCLLFPDKKYTTRKAVPVKNDTKSVDTETECWMSLVSTDGGNTWYVSNISCTEIIIFSSSSGGTPVVGLDPPASGGGSSSGSGTASAGPTTSSLASDAKNNLDAAKVKIDQFCMAHNILGAVWNSNLTIATNGSLTSVGDYNPKTGLMQFQSASGITDIALLHELTHAYQGYLGGTSVNTQTMEFEAWLMEDLYLINQGNDALNLTWSRYLSDGKLKIAYYNWAKQMLYTGQVTYQIDGLGQQVNCCEFFREKFVALYPKYQSYLPGNNQLFAVDKLLNICK